MPKWAIIGALWLWFAVALFTHHGAASPYSYAGAVVGSTMQRIDGVVVNHDAPSVRPVTQFFYDGSDLPFAKAHNLKLPLHSFLVACVAGFVRSYILANDIVNLLALWLLSYVAVTLAETLAFPREATLIASLTCAFLPVYTHYIGQPMHYVVGIAVNFLVMIAVMAGVRDPLRLGMLTAILTLSYDPYVFIAALLTWIAVTLRWKRIQDWGLYVAAALLPLIAWRAFLGLISNDVVSMKVRDEYFAPLIAGWLDVITQPLSHLLTPFVNAHLGLVTSIKMTLALVYWPVLLVFASSQCRTGFSLSKREGQDEACPTSSLPLLLAAFFVIEQLVTAAYDWELNPRRAIPLLFAFSCAYFVAVRDRVHLRPWRIAFLVVMVLSAVLTVSDVLTRNPAIGYMVTGEAMRDPTKHVVEVGETRLTTNDYPKLMRDNVAKGFSPLRYRHRDGLKPVATLFFANAFVGAFVVALLFLLRERALLPRHVPAAAAIVFLLSLGARLL